MKSHGSPLLPPLPSILKFCVIEEVGGKKPEREGERSHFLFPPPPLLLSPFPWERSCHVLNWGKADS